MSFFLRTHWVELKEVSHRRKFVKKTLCLVMEDIVSDSKLPCKTFVTFPTPPVTVWSLRPRRGKPVSTPVRGGHHPPGEVKTGTKSGVRGSFEFRQV